MKRGILKIFALMVLFFTSIPLARSAEIAIAPFQIAAGETVTQPVNVNLSEADGDMFEYQGFQLDLTLPVGISVDYDQTKMLGALSGFEISFNDKINRLVAYTKGDAVSTATELMGIAFKASDDIKAGIYPIDISKVIFSTPLGKDKILDDYSTTVTVIQPVLEGFYLYIPDFPIYRGGNYSATLNLEHGDLEMVDYRGLQFDLLNVPSYISIDLEKTVVNALGNGYSIKARKLGDSSYRFLVYAGGETASTILDTDLITIYFTASKEAPIGDVVVNNEKQILASNLGQDWTLGTSSTTITILPESPVPVESVTITPSTVLLPAGGNAYQLTATVMPENATDKTLSWSSSDPTVATVDQDGKVTPLVAGYTTITATANDGSEKFGTCEVTVYDIEVIPETMTLKVEDVANLTANILPEGFTNPEGWNIQWTSSDPTVVSVDQTGKITALKVGENIIITATFGEVSATCVINVVTNLVPVTSITVSPEYLYIPVGGAAQTLTAEVMPENATDKRVSWTIAPLSGVATVNQNGEVAPVAPGYAKVTATTTDDSDLSDSSDIVVYNITLNKIQTSLITGESEELTATTLPADFMPAGWNVVWTSSNSSVVSVDNNGKITAVGAGTATITATFGEASATCIVNVTAPNQISIYIDNFSLYAGDSYNAQVKVSPEIESTPYSAFQFDITVPEQLSITSKETTLEGFGNVTIVPLTQQGDNVFRVTCYGSTSNPSTSTQLMTITFTADKDAAAGTYDMPINEGYLSTPKGADIVATPSTTKVTIKRVTYRVAVDPKNLEIQEGTHGKIGATVTVTPADKADDYTIVWTSSNPDVATVDQDGNVTAVSEGKCVITATVIVNGEEVASDSSDITVTKTPVKPTLTVVPEEAELKVGKTLGLDYIINPTEAGENANVRWTSSDPSVATVDPETGQVTAVGEGECTITATAYDEDGKEIASGDAKITVTAIEYTVKIDPDDFDLKEGESQHLDVVIEPEYEGDYTIVWESDNEDVATVDEEGNVTGVGEGEAHITGKVYDEDGNLIGEAEATVKVTPATPEPEYTVKIEPDDFDLKEGESQHLDVVIEPEYEGDYTIVWESDNEDVATVDEDGNVTGVGEGEAHITGKVYDEDGNLIGEAETTVTVTPATPEPEYTVKIEPDDFDLKEGESQHLDVVIEPEYEGDYTIVWESDNEDVAIVDEDGNVTGVGEGEAHITGKVYDEDGNLIGEAEATVTVTPATPEPEYTVKIEPDDFDLKEGESQHLDVVIEPEYEGDYTIVWESDNEDVAIVDEDGNVTGVGEGEAHITGKVYDEDGNLIGEAEATVTVTPATPEPEYTVKIEPSEVELEEGESTQLEVVIEPEYEGGYIVKWESSDEGVATVDEEGNVTGVGEGECTITGTVYDEEGNEIGKATATVVVKGETPEVPETPEIPVTPGIVGWYGNDNGTYVSEIKIREGNQLGLFVNEAMGGYPAGWNYLWYDPEENVLGDEHENWTTAELYGAAANSGDNQAISVNVYNVYVYDYDNEDNIYWETTLPTAKVNVYKRPQIPTQLLRKGQSATGGQDTPETGTSCTFVIMMTPLSNQQILDLGYSYVYGYTDQSGEMHKLDDTERRYTHTTSDIYWNTGYKFWAYSKWTYPDGSVVTSGLRYLDGGEDPDFDASDFSGNRTIQTSSEDVLIGIYSLDGSFVGMDAQRLQPGIYIIRNTKSSQKVIIF